MSVTLKDIAEALGLSVTTVSRALTGQGRISSATRDRVLSKALEMGYAVKPAPGSRDGHRHICIVFNSRLQNLSGDLFYSTGRKKLLTGIVHPPNDVFIDLHYCC